MGARDFDWLPVKDLGRIVGYVDKADLRFGKCQRHRRLFQDLDLLPHSAGLLDLLRRLREVPRIFVTEGGDVVGIATRGDLQRAPVRMLMFGLITLLEMQIIRLVRAYYPGDSWISFLRVRSVNNARDLQAERKQRNEAIDLADCLQFADKGQLILRSPQIRQFLGVITEGDPKVFLSKAVQLRNKLAHGQDLASGSSWVEVIATFEGILSLLEKCEAALTVRANDHRADRR
ncbi:MAG TPA: CBS domain-containing protein [Thermoplasmata archaeon]|nr:CBS domain-containing protein [Thermoplasmata archaeon]